MNRDPRLIDPHDKQNCRSDSLRRHSWLPRRMCVRRVRAVGRVGRTEHCAHRRARIEGGWLGVTMSTERHHGRIIPLCRHCRTEANAVIAFDDGREDIPCCAPCSTRVIDNGGREYPLETYYPPGNKQTGQFEPEGSGQFELYGGEPDEDNKEWMYADNEERSLSSVRLDDMA